MSKIKLNANISIDIYKKAKYILGAQKRSMTGYIEESLKLLIKKEQYKEDKKLFDNLATEPVTRDMMFVEEECVHDGQQ